MSVRAAQASARYPGVVIPAISDASYDQRRADPVLFFVVMALTAFGLVMVYSASAVFAAANVGDSLYYFKRQLINMFVGLAAMMVVFRFGYHRLVRWGYPLLLFTALMLVLVLIPGLGSRAGGSSRWIRIGSFGFQPGELAKITFIVYLACSLTRKKEKIKAFGKGFLPHLMVCGVLILLLLGQPDFGTAATLTIMLFFMLFLAVLGSMH